MPGCRRFNLDGSACRNTLQAGFDCGRHTARSLSASTGTPRSAADAAVADHNPFGTPLRVSDTLGRCCPDHPPPPVVTPGETWLMDVDGTLCDVSDAAKHLDPATPGYSKKYAMVRFHEAGLLAPPNPPVVDLARQVHAAGGRVVVVTARSGRWAAPTTLWLADNNIPFEQVHSRLEGDGRPDAVVKAEILEQLRADGHRVAAAVDDNPVVIGTWCHAGIPVVTVPRDWS